MEVTDVERDIPVRGDVTIKGRAVTYSGFPVADASVAVNLSAGGRAWWNTPVSFASLADTTTDAVGRFSIICTDALLAGSPVDKGIFTADITVTSASGENRTAATAFSLGKQLILPRYSPRQQCGCSQAHEAQPRAYHSQRGEAQRDHLL